VCNGGCHRFVLLLLLLLACINHQIKNFSEVTLNELEGLQELCPDTNYIDIRSLKYMHAFESLAREREIILLTLLPLCPHRDQRSRQPETNISGIQGTPSGVPSGRSIWKS
jgi:hypothetical protein